MPRQVAATSAMRRTRASSAERHQRDGDESSTGDARPQQGRLRRVRSFTTRSGTVVNRGDSFKVRGVSGGKAGDRDGGEPTRRRQHAADDASSRQPHVLAAAATSPRRPRERDRKTDPVLASADEVMSAETLYTVLVLGSQGVGKTTVTQQLLTSEYLANKDNNFGELSVPFSAADLYHLCTQRRCLCL